MEGQTAGEEKSFSEHPSQKPASSLVFIFRLTAVFLAVDKGAVKAGCCVVVMDIILSQFIFSVCLNISFECVSRIRNLRWMLFYSNSLI